MTYKGTTQAERKALLERAREAQHEFWEAMRSLEHAYDPNAEIDHPDMQDITIEILDEEMRAAGFHVVDTLCPGE